MMVMICLGDCLLASSSSFFVALLLVPPCFSFVLVESFRPFVGPMLVPQRDLWQQKRPFTMENIDFRKGTGAAKECKKVPFGGPLEDNWGPFGRPLRSLGLALGSPESPLAPHLGIIGVSWVSLGLLWGFKGPPWTLSSLQRPFWYPFWLPKTVSGHHFEPQMVPKGTRGHHDGGQMGTKGASQEQDGAKSSPG